MKSIFFFAGVKEMIDRGRERQLFERGIERKYVGVALAVMGDKIVNFILIAAEINLLFRAGHIGFIQILNERIQRRGIVGNYVDFFRIHAQ